MNDVATVLVFGLSVVALVVSVCTALAVGIDDFYKDKNRDEEDRL